MTDIRENTPSLRKRTARSLKWNTIDRLSTQVLYAVTGVVLANVLSQEDFGLVGVILVFQAFAGLFVDSGFGSALLQKKEPTQRDYSTVFWFNLIVAVGIYMLLYICAPCIADIFKGDRRLIPLSRVMFLAFVINGLAIVQTNRLMKQMDVKRIAVSNIAGLTLSGIAGIWLALHGYGAWALVWQTVILASVKTVWLWAACRWRPSFCLSRESLRSIWRVGTGVLVTSFLNTVFLQIYSVVIGIWYTFTALGNYTQAEKWSKMGSASLSQIMTYTFVPLLSKFQDDSDRYNAMLPRINALAAVMVFPLMGGMAVCAPAIFHTFFGDKWDVAIPLFQLLVIRGIFAILCSLLSNHLLALGYPRTMVTVEIVKDLTILAAIGATVWMGSLDALVWGQLVAGILTWVVILFMTARASGIAPRCFVEGMGRYVVLSLLAMAIVLPMQWLIPLAPLCLVCQITGGAGIYLGLLYTMKDKTLVNLRNRQEI